MVLVEQLPQVQLLDLSLVEPLRFGLAVNLPPHLLHQSLHLHLSVIQLLLLLLHHLPCLDDISRDPQEQRQQRAGNDDRNPRPCTEERESGRLVIYRNSRDLGSGGGIIR